MDGYTSVVFLISDISLLYCSSSGEVLKAGQHSVLFCDFEQAQASSANDRCSQGPNSM